jgi:hypothetical protein
VPKPDGVPGSIGWTTKLNGCVSLSWYGVKSGSKVNPYEQKVIVKYVVLPLAAPVPTHIEQLVYSFLTGRQPCELSHPEEDWGKVLYFVTAFHHPEQNDSLFSHQLISHFLYCCRKLNH